jgi:DNA-directed RNA polymerase specialized sigma24 family protein
VLDWLRLTPAVDRAAGAVASNFPAHHDISDIKQELWVWIMENKPTVLRILSDSEGTLTAIEQLLMKAATSYLRKEDASSYGYQQEDQYNYSVETIKSILEVIFRYEDWQSFAMSQDTQPKAKANPAHGGNNLASYADVKSAVEKLPEDYYNLIVWRYKYQHTFTQIGADTGTSKQSANERHSRALKAIQALLGQQPISELRKGFDGRTEGRGTASANARTERDYEG